MKIIVNKNELVNAVSMAQKAVSTKTNIVAIEGVLLNACSTTLTITAFDLEMGIETSIPADCQAQGSVIVNAKLFGDVIRRLSDDTVAITVTKEDHSGNYSVFISCGQAKINMTGIDSSEFPKLPSIDEAKSFNLPFSILAEIIDKTIYATTNVEGRKNISGGLFSIGNGKFEMACLDGYRVSKKFVAIESDLSANFIVPTKVLSEVSKAVKDDCDVIVYFNNQYIAFSIANTRFISRLIEGDFTNYNSFIPTSFDIEIEINREIFLKSIEAAEPIILSDNAKIPVILDIHDGFMKLSSVGKFGSFEDCIYISDDNINFKIAFNYKYLSEFLKAVDSEYVELCFNSPLMPCVILDCDDENLTYMVLPVRT